MSNLFIKFTGINFSSIPFDVNKPFRLIVEKCSDIDLPPSHEIKTHKIPVNFYINHEGKSTDTHGPGNVSSSQQPQQQHQQANGQVFGNLNPEATSVSSQSKNNGVNNFDLINETNFLDNCFNQYMGQESSCLLNYSTKESIVDDLRSQFSDLMSLIGDLSEDTNGDMITDLPVESLIQPSQHLMSDCSAIPPSPIVKISLETNVQDKGDLSDDNISLNPDSRPTSSDSSSDEEMMVEKDHDETSVPKTSKPSHSKMVDHLKDDRLLKLTTKVNILRLPDSVIKSKLPARKLDKVYSQLNTELFSNGFDYVRRYVPKYIPEDDDSDDEVMYLQAASKTVRTKPTSAINLEEEYDSDQSNHESKQSVTKRKEKAIFGQSSKQFVIDFTDDSGSSDDSGDFDDSDDSDDTDSISDNSYVSDICFTSDDEELESQATENPSEVQKVDSLPCADDRDLQEIQIQETNFKVKTEPSSITHRLKPKRKSKLKVIQLSSDDEQGNDFIEIIEENEAVTTTDSTEISSSEKKERKNIRSILSKSELEYETKKATSNERKRVERISEQEKNFSRLLPEIEKDIDEPSLILDIDIDTKKPRVEVSRLLVKELKPHQIDGIKFLYNSTIENIDKLKDEGSGCILAHCMGLGKSLQVITFVHTLLSNPLTKSHIKTILIVVPVNTLRNWAEEFDKWITKKGLRCFNVYEMIDCNDIMAKAQLVENWSNAGGILIIGIQGLATLLHLQSQKKVVSSSLVYIVEKYLCDPGPDMVIIDEGHLLKDHKTRICKSVDRIKTKRKIILTGTPLQNNLDEYHTMISIIKPRLLGSKKEFANRFRNPIENGQKADSNAYDVRLMKQRSTILNKLLSGCIQRFGYDILKPYLKPKLEYTIFIRPSKKMAEMYNYYLDQVQKRKLLLDATVLRLCVNHPALYQLQADGALARQEATIKYKMGNKKSPEDFQSVDLLYQPSTSSSTFSSTCSTSSTLTSTSTDNTTDTCIETEDISLKKDWYKQFSQPDDWKNCELSGKFTLLFKILKSCIAVDDKLLVVSQSLETLDLIEKSLEFHKEFTVNDEKIVINWNRGQNYYRIDGANKGDERLYQVKQFNDLKNIEARLFLLSTKAGGVGINLIGANRCIIFDVSWNPSDDIQAIFRVFRFGQPKPVYVYRFVTKDTMEEKIFRKQIVKLGMAIRVIDKHQVKRAFKAAELAEFYAARPKEEYEISLPDVPQDRLLADILHDDNKEVLECTIFDSLLEKKPDEELTEDERQSAWAEYQKERDAEIQEAEERKKALEAERQKESDAIKAAEQQEKERIDLENERKKFEESVAVTKENLPFVSTASTTSSPIVPTTTLATASSSSTSAMTSILTSTSTVTSAVTTAVTGTTTVNPPVNKPVSIAPKPQKTTSTPSIPGQNKPSDPAVNHNLNGHQPVIESSSGSNPVSDSNNSNNRRGSAIEEPPATNGVSNGNHIEEVYIDSASGSEQPIEPSRENAPVNRSLFGRPSLASLRNEVLNPRLVHSLNANRTAFAYKAISRPRVAVPNLSCARNRKKRKLETNNPVPTNADKAQAEEAATVHAINNAFPKKRVYGFENPSAVAPSRSAATSRPIPEASTSKSTSNSRPSATVSTPPSRINNNQSASTHDTTTRTVHQPNSGHHRIDQSSPRLRDQGPYSNLNHHSSNRYYANGTNSTVPSTPSSSQQLAPPQAHQGLSASSSSAFTGVSPGSSFNHNQSNPNVISTYNHQSSQQFREYGDYQQQHHRHHQQQQPPSHAPYHHISSPYFANRQFNEAPPNFDRSQQVRRLSFPNGNLSTPIQPVVQQINSVINDQSNNQNNNNLNSADPISSNLPFSLDQPNATIENETQRDEMRNVENEIVTPEMTDEECEQVLNNCSDINLATVSLTNLLNRFLNRDGLQANSPECADTIIVELEKILTALNRKKDKLDRKSCIDLLTEIEVIEKINCESMLTNIRAQFSIITTNDNSTAQPNQTL